MKKFRRNLFLFFIVLTLITVMFTSCPPNQDPTPKYKTLTLDGKMTYYFLDGNWYDNSACETPLEDLSLESKKPGTKDVSITLEFGGDEVTTSNEDKNVFFIKGDNKFTFEFSYYTEEGKDTNYFVDELKLPKDGIGNNVKLVSKYETKQEKRKLPMLTGGTGTFEGYKLNGTGDKISAGEEITITAKTVNCTYIAQWVPIYTLTLDGTPSAYFKNGAWYSDDACKTALENNTVKVLEPITYKATLDLDYGSIEGNITELTATRNFLGYYAKDASENAQALIGADGNVSKYTISADTELASKMSKAYFTKPENEPTRENYKFDGWQVNGFPYDFEKTEAKNGITIKALWTYTGTVSDEVSPTDVEAWKVALGNFVSSNGPYDAQSYDSKNSFTKEHTKEVSIDEQAKTVVYSSGTYMRMINELKQGSGVETGTVDINILGKIDGESFKLIMYAEMGETEGEVTPASYASYQEGDGEPQKLDVMKILGYMQGSSGGPSEPSEPPMTSEVVIDEEYKKPIAILIGVVSGDGSEWDYLDQVTKYFYNNMKFDESITVVNGEKDIYEKGETKKGDSSGLTFRFKSNGDITLTLNITSETEGTTTSVPLTINFDITTVAGERAVVTADSYMYVKKDGEYFKKFPLDKLGYDIEGQQNI